MNPGTDRSSATGTVARGIRLAVFIAIVALLLAAQTDHHERRLPAVQSCR